MPRLNKVLQELNIGFDTAKDYLRETFGISILSVNKKITEAQYQALLKKYKADKVFYSVIRKTFRTRPTKKNPKGIPAVFNDEEKIVAQELGNILETKRYLAKDRKKKGKRISKGKSKSSSYLTNYVYGYVRIISVPFGGQRRR
jgi:hypothetical protein